jgi:hypothetical protein
VIFRLRLNRRVLAFPLTLCAVFGVIAACVGDDPDNAGGKNPGERGGPCNQGQCLVGLQCVDNVCVVGPDGGGVLPNADGGGDPGDGSAPSDGGAPSCKRNVGNAFVPTNKPTADPQPFACDPAPINDLIEAGCAPNLEQAPCTDARTAGNPTCMSCIFSPVNKDQWGAMIIGPPSRPNHASCIDNLVAPDGGGPLRGCGVEHVRRAACQQFFCDPCRDSALTACLTNVDINECNTYRPRQECTNAMMVRNALPQCYDTNAVAAFRLFARLQCSQ